MPRLPLSCALIVKNEEDFLRQALTSVAPFIEELIFLDSGSTDRTKEIAYSFEKEVPGLVWKEEKWRDDFSWARNQAARYAQCPWILFIDGDEVLDTQALPEIKKILQSSDAVCYSFIQRNYTWDHGIENLTRHEGDLPPGYPQTESKPLYYFENWMERLYRTDVGLHYEGRIHETLLKDCQRKGLLHKSVPIILHHYGRLKPNTEKKVAYYLQLSKQKWKEDTENPVSWFELATSLMEIKDFEEAFKIGESAIKKFPKVSEILKVAFQAALRTDRFSQAEKWIRDYLRIAPNDLSVQAQLSTALLYQKKFPEALRVALNVLEQDKMEYVAHVNALIIYFEEKNYSNASRHCDAALQLKPTDDFLLQARKKIDQFMTHQ